MHDKRILPWLLGCVLLVTACNSLLDPEAGKANDGEYVDVTFAVSPQQDLRTRATVNGGTYVPSIAQGQNVDVLIYEVYEVVRDESKENKPITDYTRLDQYGSGDSVHDITPGEGQTLVDVSKVFPGDSKDITLRLMRNKEYAIAFWAQSSQTNAFTTNTENTDTNPGGLRAVTVNYENADNNDELRDAFCKVEVFTVSPNQTIDVILQRPFAQINVGTTGADYHNHLMFYPNQAVLYSAITLSGVMNRIDVVTDQIDCTDGFKKQQVEDGGVTFNLSPIAAYLDRNVDAYFEEYLSLLKEKPEEYGDEAYMAALREHVIALTGTDDISTTEGKANAEEFLMINLDGHSVSGKHNENANDMGYLKYQIDYPTLDEDGDVLTETFKYISMCYVLVPASASGTEVPKQDGPYDKYNSSVLNSVTVTMSNGLAKGDYAWSREIKVETVPVHRNWRTNILGGLSKVNKNHPDQPDDPSSFFDKAYVPAGIYLQPAFEGEYNSQDKGGMWAEKGSNNQQSE